MPVVEPTCPSDQFVNGDNKCVPKTECSSDQYCGGSGGYYDESMDDCFCEGASAPEDFCDATCQFEALKVYFTYDGKIEMESNGRSRVFDVD